MLASRARPSLAAQLGISRPMALILFTVFLDLLGIGLIFPIGPFYASSFGANAFEVGLLFTSYSIAQFLTIPILGALSDRLGRRPVLLSCIAGEAVGYLLFGAASSLGILFGPVVGGFLGGINLRLPAFVAAGLVVINCLSAIVWLPESLPHERRARVSLARGANPFGVLLKLLRRPLLRAPL